MRLAGQQGINRHCPWNYGCMLAIRQNWSAHLWFTAMLVLAALAPEPVRAQAGSQPGFDPQQTEKRFDALQSERAAATARSGVQIPRVSRSEAPADSTPLVVLRKVSLTGARAIPQAEIARAYQPYLGKK